MGRVSTGAVVVVCLAAACVGGADEDERVDAPATLGGKELVLYAWPWSGPAGDGVSRILGQTERLAEISTDLYALPHKTDALGPVKRLTVTLDPGEAEFWNDRMGVGTNMGFMLVHASRTSRAAGWAPVTCGDARPNERPLNAGYTMFDDRTEIDYERHRISTQVDGPVGPVQRLVGFGACGITEADPIFGLMVFPWANFRNMEGSYYAEYRLECDGMSCDHVSCERGVSCLANGPVPIDGSGMLLYATSIDPAPADTTRRLHHIDPVTLEIVSTTALDQTPLDLAMTSNGRLFSLSSRLWSAVVFETGSYVDQDHGWWEQKSSTTPILGIGFGPDGAGGERLLGIDQVGGIWDLMFDGQLTGTPLQIGTLGLSGVLASADIVWTRRAGWVVTAVESIETPGSPRMLGSVQFGVLDPSSSTPPSLRALPSDRAPVHLAATPEGSLVGQIGDGTIVSIDDPSSPSARNRGQSTQRFDVVTSPWRP